MDGLLDLDGGQRPEKVATDTASYSDRVFGLFTLLQGIAHRSRDDHGAQAGHLVVEIVRPSQAPALAEVSRIRPGIEGGDRYYEPHSVNGRQQAGTPALGKTKTGLGPDEPGSGRYGLPSLVRLRSALGLINDALTQIDRQLGLSIDANAFVARLGPDPGRAWPMGAG